MWHRDAMRPVSLPMYDADRGAVAAFWRGVAAALRRREVDSVADHPAWPDDLGAHWLDARLLLSQSCGYPLVTSLAGRVQLVGAFRYTADGCDGVRYRSQLVVRRDDPARSIEDCRGRVVAFNSSESQSGYHALLSVVAPLADGGRFFARAVASGSHRRSIEAVQRGEADVAAIDCVSFAAMRREGWVHVRVIGQTEAAPGLPLITSAETSADDLAALRDALHEACADPALADVRCALFIDGFETLPFAAYDDILAMRRRALALGCATL